MCASMRSRQTERPTTHHLPDSRLLRCTACEGTNGVSMRMPYFCNVACGVAHKSRRVPLEEICIARTPGRTACAPGRTACAERRFRAHPLNLGAASVCVAIYHLPLQAAEPAPSGNTMFHVALLLFAITNQFFGGNTTVRGAERVLLWSFPFRFD